MPAVAVAMVGISSQFFYLPNDDATWLMAVARRMFDGATLYSRDLVEINPPLIVWLTALAVRLGDWTHIESVVAWRLIVGAQVLLSLWLSARVLSSSRRVGNTDLYLLLLAVLAWVLACLPAYDFGQREHFIVLWLTPYLLAEAAWSTGVAVARPLRVAAGILLGLVVCLKPHYLLAVGLIEAGVVTQSRSVRAPFRTTTMTAAACVLLYGLVVAIWYPGFFTVAVPLALRYYPSYGALELRPVHLVYWTVVLAAVASTWSPRIAAAQVRLFALAGAGSFVAYLLQSKGWPYHFLPAKAFFVIATTVGVTVLMAKILESWPVFSQVPTRRTVLVTGLAVAVVAVSVATTRAEVKSYYASRNARVVQRLYDYLSPLDFGPGQRRFAALSMSLFPAFPINELMHAEWSSRFSCLWILPGIVEAEQRNEAHSPSPAAGREYLEGAVCDDFERWWPQVVLVEESRQMSVLQQLLKSERFRAIWQEYRLVGEVEYFHVFQRVGSMEAGRPEASAPGAAARGRGEGRLAVPPAVSGLEPPARDRPPRAHAPAVLATGTGAGNRDPAFSR